MKEVVAQGQAVQRRGDPPILTIQIGRMRVPLVNIMRSQKQASDFFLNYDHLLN
jgi:hypothetical protein